MKATLIITAANSRTRRYKLARTTARNGKSNGLNISRSQFCRVLNGKRFQDLRDVIGARIETDDVDAITRALRLTRHEPGIVEIKDKESSKKRP